MSEGFFGEFPHTKLDNLNDQKVSYKQRQDIVDDAMRSLVDKLLVGYKEGIECKLVKRCEEIYSRLHSFIDGHLFDVVDGKHMRVTMEENDLFVSVLPAILTHDEIKGIIFYYYIEKFMKDYFRKEYGLNIGFGCPNEKFAVQFYIEDPLTELNSNQNKILLVDGVEYLFKMPYKASKTPYNGR